MQRIPLLFLLFLFCLASPLAATELYEDKKVARIELIVDTPGEKQEIDPKFLLSRMRTKTGNPFSQLTFDTDLKTLSEDYERVEPSLQMQNGELIIVIHLVPKPYIHLIEWNGNRKFSSSTLREELGIQPGALFDRQSFSAAFNKVKKLYFKKGYFEAQLSYTIEPIPGTNEVDILIDIDEGRPGHIQKIVLQGFTKDEKDEIEEHMYLKKYNFLTSWLTGAGIYRDELLEQDRITILNTLQNRGYADARVDIELSEDPETGRLIVDITAHRGQLFHFGAISFEGNCLFPTEELFKRSLIKEGAPYSPEKIRETSHAIKEFYGQKGYIDASVQFETYLKETSAEFDVVFSIDEGRQYKIGLIHIFGNTSTQSNVILRESLLVPGETFDARKLKATQERLEAVGYFKSVNVYAVRTLDDDKLGSNYRDVYIEVEEMPTGSINLFLGFTSIDSVYGGLDLTERNFNILGFPKLLIGRPSALRGAGQFFHVRGTLGKKENNVLISWMDPYLNDSLWRFGFELSRTYSLLQKDVQVVTYGGSVYTNYPLSQYWTAGMRQRLRHSKDILNIEPLDNSAIARASVTAVQEQLDQKGLISAFSGNLSYDSTDSAYKPRRGWRSYFETEVAGIGGNYNFFKVSYINSIYFPLWRKGTLKLRGDFRYLFPFGKTDKEHVPYSERFFLGGENTVRGYRNYILGPVVELLNAQGELQETQTPYGALSASLFSIEYNQEILPILDLFAFVDVGSAEFSLLSIRHIRPSTGVGARLDIGNRTPIMVGWGIPLVKEDRKNKWQKLFFAMGGQF